MGRVDHRDDVLQDRSCHRVLACRKLIGDLDRRLERRRLVPVVRVVHPADGRCATRDLRHLTPTRVARVAQAPDAGADLVQPRHVLRSAHHDQAQRPPLHRAAVVEDPNPVGGCGGDGVHDALHVPVVGVELARLVAE